MRKIFKVLSLVIIVLSLAACGDEDSAAEPVKATESKVDTLNEGENGFTMDETILGVGENDKNLKLVTKYAGANNVAELQSMVGAGKAVLVDIGTPITLIEHGFLKDKIKLTETGEIGWIPSENVSKDMPE
ncbi:hypothetical protein SC499_20305 [Peribacillus simplex]|uniref:hypothetical protein n=1 Tax=Peribacillus simplex TaxID=1478 RepID=UPI00298E5C5B|nr:hypothetical protein [Peribacillus simplex]MDW7616993.1 hypothetical protein [Peribacillus simplex]